MSSTLKTSDSSNSIGGGGSSGSGSMNSSSDQMFNQQQQQVSRAAPAPVLTLDASTAKLMYQTSSQMSNYLLQIANEPTIGLFHVQDHIRRNIPKNVELKKNIKNLGEKIQEKSFDIDYSTKTIKAFKEIETFSNISTLLQSSIEKANKLVNNKSLLFINSQIAQPSSSKTFTSFQQQHKSYQQQQPATTNNTSNNYGTLSVHDFNNQQVQPPIISNEEEKENEDEEIKKIENN